MSYRRIKYIPVLLLLLALTGCAAGGVFGTATPEERRKSAASKDDLWNQTIALEKEKAAYQKQLTDQQAEIDRMNKELTDQQLEIDHTSKQATELTGALDDLTAKVKQLQDAKQREYPLREADLTQPVKMTGKPGKKSVAVPKKETQKKSPPLKVQEPKSKSDRDPQMKPLLEAEQAEQKVIPLQETEPAPVKKEAGKESPEVKLQKPRSVEDLSAQMKQFEEVRQKGTAREETDSGQTKKEPLKQGKRTAVPKKDAQKEPAEKEARETQTATIKVLAGDGNIASARGISKQLAKMGYRVKSIDRAPRSDFEVTTVYYGSDHRTAAETMAKRLGDGAITKPLTWSTSFNIIVVTGRKP